MALFSIEFLKAHLFVYLCARRLNISVQAKFGKDGKAGISFSPGLTDSLSFPASTPGF